MDVIKSNIITNNKPSNINNRTKSIVSIIDKQQKQKIVKNGMFLKNFKITKKNKNFIKNKDYHRAKIASKNELDIYSFIFSYTVLHFSKEIDKFLSKKSKLNINTIEHLFQYLYDKRRQIYILKNINLDKNAYKSDYLQHELRYLLNKKKFIELHQRKHLQDFSIKEWRPSKETYIHHPLSMNRFKYNLPLLNRILLNFDKFHTSSNMNQLEISFAKSYKFKYSSMKELVKYQLFINIERNRTIDLRKSIKEVQTILHTKKFISVINERSPDFFIYNTFFYSNNYTLNREILGCLLVEIDKTKSDNKKIKLIMTLYYNFIYAMMTVTGTASCGEMLLYSLFHKYNFNYTINQEVLLDVESLTLPINIFLYKCFNKIKKSDQRYIEYDEKSTPFLVKSKKN